MEDKYEQYNTKKIPKIFTTKEDQLGYFASGKENFDGRHGEEQQQRAYKVYDQKRQ